jgi:DnaK suppressor protein
MPLTASQREALSRSLVARGEQLRNEIGEDRLADLNAEPEVAALERDVIELREVEGAFARVNDADFGLCADCREEIPWTRLEANPSALRCVDCQARHERR